MGAGLSLYTGGQWAHARLGHAIMKNSAIAGTVLGKLYLVATPIGNLEDITLRALRVLKECDLIACEDTRHTQKLLNNFGIQKRTLSYHEHNEETRAAELVKEMENGATVALVSDAGTPVISDPGHRLVASSVARGISVIPVPGASSVVAALAASGISAERFLFVGFLPPRQGERRKALRELATQTSTLVFFEAPHRVAGMLSDAADILGARNAVVAREITKLHEEFRRGTLLDLSEMARKVPPKGEITVVVGPGDPDKIKAPPPGQTLAARIEQICREQGIDRKAALKQAARELGIARREAYKQLLLEAALPGKTN
jgi:16S rRNA (cytidine1402-2'-O)-methyltransferase